MPDRKADRSIEGMVAVACAGLPQHARHRGLQGCEWAERGEVTLTEAARMLNLSPATVLRQIRAGIIPPSNNAKAPLESSNDGISKIRI